MSSPPRVSATSTGPSHDSGFTLLELMLIMSMMGLLMLMAFAGMANFRTYAMRTSCVSQQRNLVTPGLLYGFENGIANQDVNAEVLLTANMIPQHLCNCPSTENNDSNDYTLVYLHGELADVTCNPMGALHPYHR
ncbi:MAG TPA: prepilin-type N-terminal cleavage/methylation domain-containing protein [Candidatus Krumholzibacteria bacterium]|nr:prepilin-type N-terminal cleavage/methylation domain-containing protein [Candidatus Krumholzibacteria bacterium]